MPCLRFRPALLWILLLASAGLTGGCSRSITPAKPQPPATILLIRHAEKLINGQIDLSPIGFERARLLPKVFAPGARPDLPTPQVLFATRLSPHSNRPVQTVTPLAAALHLPIDSSFANEDYAALAAALLSGKYAGKVVLVVWHHGKIPELATALGAKPPYNPWPENQYDRIWRIDYINGKVTLQDLPYALLPGDSNNQIALESRLKNTVFFIKMTDLPDSLFANPVWNALHSKHRHFAVSTGDACRYPADVAPFAAVASATEAALLQLHSLLVSGEDLWIVGESYPHPPQLVFEQTLECLQMVLPAEVVPPAPTAEIVPLSGESAPEMVALTDIAFPGFFRSKTCEMGSYFGIRSENQLIAMGGERLTLDGYPEISGICTHPDHRGKGYAESLIWHLARHHRREGLVSWLHVSAANHRAIQLYLRLGFIEIRRVTLHRVSRKD